MKNKTLHIISFDIPLPADYGGVIDVFYKIVNLNKQGCNIILHLFEYGRDRKYDELIKYCSRIYYYKRKTSPLNHFSLKPYIVKSRKSSELISNLNKDNHPILCEGLHTSAILESAEIDKTRVNIRSANIEFDYYKKLAKNESNFFRRLYFYIESFKLKKYEKILSKASSIICVSNYDRDYYNTLFHNSKDVYTVFPFHADNDFVVDNHKGNYCFYHGNLSVNENIDAAIYLIKNVWPKLKDIKLKIAGKNPPQSLINLVNKFDNIELIPNPTDSQLIKLVRQAQINVLYTNQATGLKLKLLKVFFNSKFIILNSKMVWGMGLDNNSLIIADSSEKFSESISNYFYKDFDNIDLEIRKKIIDSKFNNNENANKILNILFQ